MADCDLRVAIAQPNLRVGDILGNTAQIIELSLRARDELGADLVAFPELALTSYPPEDLLMRPGLYRRVHDALAELGEKVHGIDMVIGYPIQDGGQLYNACSVLRDGDLVVTYYKQQLPNYSVFDEKRYFHAGSAPSPAFEVKGIKVALSICEDVWEPGAGRQARAAGADLMLNINASPFHLHKSKFREQVLARNLAEGRMPICYVNLVGGQDELVFDGASMVMGRSGELAYRAPEFEQCLHAVDFSRDAAGILDAQVTTLAAPLTEEESAYRALVLGVRDYIHKNGFNGGIIGLSGGIDSALTLAIAADALGGDAVEAVLMPSQYTAAMSIEDAQSQADALGVAHHIISIKSAVTAFEDGLANRFKGLAPDTTEENIQARCRGVFLMAISNKSGRIVLATGNKSEMSVGYATLYGDMAGGFAPLKDVSKTLVYRLARWRNTLGAAIPERVITRPPTAELKPDQKDEDSLPPYAILDPILERYIELDQTPREIIAAGFDAEQVLKAVRLVDRAEYKRRQAAPGVRITKRAFGRDRRFPITSGYDERAPSAKYQE